MGKPRSVSWQSGHERPPTATLDVRPWEREPVRFLDNDPPRNRHFLTRHLHPDGDAIDVARRVESSFVPERYQLLGQSGELRSEGARCCRRLTR